MSVLDLYSTLKSGATMHLIPAMYFSFPLRLLEYMQKKRVNTIYWVPSALSIVANMKALDRVELPDLKKILFAGEVMPMKQLNVWRRHFPDALFANLYGPTEITDICTYYILDREFEDYESLPIGYPCANTDILIITEDGRAAEDGEEGELCVRGSFLSHGYYNNPEKTSQVFVQNPLNPWYPELIYKTGDLVKKNERGEIIYLTRKDFQIKHMGYRIELGEIETAVGAVNGVRSCACVYESESDQIILYYEGEEMTDKEMIAAVKNQLPVYMHPNRIIHMDVMPHNANGKIDRIALKNKK
jgi:acyl-coenzyme A synthetase/AMP-(fatty) acid ligase